MLFLSCLIRATFLAACEMFFKRNSFLLKDIIKFANFGGEFGETRNPVLLSSIRLGMPPTEVEITGVPIHCASQITFGLLST